jgi:hypothetical protein
MSEWLLIVMLLSSSGATEPFTLEFPTREACLSGEALVRLHWSPTENIESWCVLRQEILEG